jgi:hypothetical protein
MSTEMIEAIPVDIEIPKKVPIVPDAYYTRKEIEEMGICGWLTLIRHERKGKLKVCRIGRLVRYRGSDLIHWLEKCTS